MNAIHLVPLRALGAALFLLALSAGRASAQQETGLLVVTVRSTAGAHPIPGARVQVVGTQASGVTDAAGVVRLAGVPLGVHAVEAGRLGYATRFAMAKMEAGTAASLSFSLDVEAIPVAEIRVGARRRPDYLVQMGFERRRQAGMGSFITRKELERQNPRFLSDALRMVAGVTISPMRTGEGYASMARTGGRPGCPIQYFVNGLLIGPGFNIDDIAASDVEALEIYRGASQLPPEFNRRNAACGVIVVWTRLE